MRRISAWLGVVEREVSQDDVSSSNRTDFVPGYPPHQSDTSTGTRSRREQDLDFPRLDMPYEGHEPPPELWTGRLLVPRQTRDPDLTSCIDQDDVRVRVASNRDGAVDGRMEVLDGGVNSGDGVVLWRRVREVVKQESRRADDERDGVEVTPQSWEERRRISEEGRKRLGDGDELCHETLRKREKCYHEIGGGMPPVSREALDTHFDPSKPPAWCSPPL